MGASKISYLTDTQGRHVKNTIDSTSITKRTALLKMVENRHFGFTPQKSQNLLLVSVTSSSYVVALA